MKTILKSVITISLVLTSPYGYADELKSSTCETAINCTVNQGDTTQTTTTTETGDDGSEIRRRSSGNTSTTTTTTTNYGSAGSAGSGAYTQAKDAKNQANMTMIAAFAMAAIMAAMCNPPTNVTPCILAPIAAIAGIMAGQKKNEAQKVMDSLGNPETTTDSTTTTTDGTGTSDNADTSVAAIKADLAKKGYKMNDDGTTTLPNGSTVASDLNAASLQAAGMSGSQISDIQSGLAKMKKDIADKAAEGAATTADAGAGGDQYGGSGGGSGDSNDLSVAGSGVEGERTGNRDPAAWTGFGKQHGDSLIGVAQADIFLMVEKRVESERKPMGQ